MVHHVLPVLSIVLLHGFPLSIMLSLIVFPLVSYVPPCGYCFQSVGLQWIVKYLSKYVVIFEVNDHEDKLTDDLTIMNILTDKEDILLLSGGFLLMWRIFYFIMEDSYFIMEDKLILYVSHYPPC